MCYVICVSYVSVKWIELAPNIQTNTHAYIRGTLSVVTQSGEYLKIQTEAAVWWGNFFVLVFFLSFWCIHFDSESNGASNTSTQYELLFSWRWEWLHFPNNNWMPCKPVPPRRCSNSKMCLNSFGEKNQQHNILTVAASLHYRHGWKIIQGYRNEGNIQNLRISFSSLSVLVRCRTFVCVQFSPIFSDGVAI